MHKTDADNLMIAQIQSQIKQLRNEISVERERINSLWWKFGILAGVISAVTGKVFGGTIGSLFSTLTGWW